jgi:uncharacterized membrane protein YdjX (TVP38/TMEM64 family)
VAALLLAALLACGALGLSEPAASRFFDSAWWTQHWAQVGAWRAESPWLFLAAFMALFTLLAALALPGCCPLALFAGTAYGTLTGSLLVGLASTVGATLSFLVARHWARQPVQRRLGHRLASVESAISRHGPTGVFWLRLLPLVPFPLLNPLLGVSRMSLKSFFWPSLWGLTLGSVPYVWAGGSLLAWFQEGRIEVGPALAVAALLVLLALWALRQRRLFAVAGFER